MFNLYVFMSVVLVLVNGQTTPVAQCIRNSGELPLNTHIVGCQATPCALPQGQDVVVNIFFRAPYTIRRMTTLATAYLFGGPIGINYPLQENAVTCNHLVNTYCPVLQDEVIQYTLRMFIEEAFPVNTAVTIEFRIVDDSSTPVVCLRVPVVIAPPLVTISYRNDTDSF